MSAYAALRWQLFLRQSGLFTRVWTLATLVFAALFTASGFRWWPLGLIIGMALPPILSVTNVDESERHPVFERSRRWPLLPTRERTRIGFDLAAVNTFFVLVAPYFFVMQVAPRVILAEVLTANGVVLLRLLREHHHERTLLSRIVWLSAQFGVWIIALALSGVTLDVDRALPLVTALMCTLAITYELRRTARGQLRYETFAPSASMFTLRSVALTLACQAAFAFAFTLARFELMHEPAALLLFGIVSTQPLGSARVFARLPFSKRALVLSVLKTEAIATLGFFASGLALSAIFSLAISAPLTLLPVTKLLSLLVIVFAARLSWRCLGSLTALAATSVILISFAWFGFAPLIALVAVVLSLRALVHASPR